MCDTFRIVSIHCKHLNGYTMLKHTRLDIPVTNLLSDTQISAVVIGADLIFDIQLRLILSGTYRLL